MVLILGSDSISSLSLHQILDAEQIISAVERFCALPREAQDFSKAKSAFVLQGELARIDTQVDPDVLLSSAQATTCIIAAAVCSETHTACICHMDDSTSSTRHMQQWLRGMQRPCIYLVGGYKEPRGIGEQIGRSILEYLQQSEIVATLKLLCVGSLNTNQDGSPINCSLTVEVKTGDTYPVGLDVGSPAILERKAMCTFHKKSSFCEFWVASAGSIFIEGQPILISRQQQEFYKYLLNLPDSEFIRMASTSPQHEHASFIPDLRKFFKWILSFRGVCPIEPMHFTWSSSGGWLQENETESPSTARHNAEESVL